MGIILDRLQTELEKTRKDGKHRRVHVDRNKFLIEVPQANRDPRFQLMSQSRPTVVIEFEKNEHITAGELLELCSRDPENPLSVTYRLAVMGLDEEHVLAVRCDQLDQLRAKQAVLVSRGGGPRDDSSRGGTPTEGAEGNSGIPEGASGSTEEPGGMEGYTAATALAAVEKAAEGRAPIPPTVGTNDVNEVKVTDENEVVELDNEGHGTPHKESPIS